MKKIMGGELSFFDGDDTLLPAGTGQIADSAAKPTDPVFAPSFLGAADNVLQAGALTIPSFVADSSVVGAVSHPDIAPTPYDVPDEGDFVEFVGYDASEVVVPVPTPEPIGPDTPTITNLITAIGLGQSGFIPPDPNGAAGPNNLVNTVNGGIQFWSKSGTLQFSDTIQHFFGMPTGGSDPKVIYDQQAGRFVVMVQELQGVGTGTAADDVSRMYVAVSDDSDPNGTWFKTSFDSKIVIGGVNYWADYPGLAVDESAIYLTTNDFRFEGSGNTASRLYIIPKSGFYSGGSASITATDPSASNPFGFNIFTMQPAQVFGDINGPTTGTYLVSTNVSFGGDEGVAIIRVDNPTTSPTFNFQFIDVGNIANGSVPGATQLGTSTTIDAGDSRAYNAVWSNNHLYFANTINTGDGQATAHWYDFNTSNLASVALTQQGNITGEDIAANTFTYYPTVAINTNGTVGIGFAASGPSIYGGAYYTVHATSDAAGAVEGSQVLVAGQGTYARFDNNGRDRWGDLSSISLDPTDNQSFWVYNEYATASNSWGTAFGKISFGATPGSVSINDMSISEGNGGTKVMTFTVTRSGGTAAFAVNFATADGTATTADHDYAANSGTLNFGTGVNTQTISVTINGDTKFEPNEAFFVNLSGATNGATISDGQGIGTIQNDDLNRAPSDFNADGTSDVFWRNNSTGHVGTWEMHNNVQTWHDLGGSGVDHKVAGIGDFNGDGTSDLFWRNDSTGHVGTWEMHNNVPTWHDLGGSGVDHKVVGIGDFNGDQTADVLWRNDASGHVGIWEMHNNVPTWHDLGGSGVDHKVAGIGDFNGDQTSDVLWRNDSSGHVGIWEMHNNVQTWHDLGGSGVDHKAVGIGDFNGDHTMDVLWRNDSTGHVGIWEMHNDVPTWHDLGGSGTDLKVAGIGDYNGDGTSDVFWRNDTTGHVGIWEMHNNVQTWHDLVGSGVDHSFIV
jgi:hypothetical protein